LIDANPCEKGGRLYNASRSDRVWSDENEAAFMCVASEPLRLAMILALLTCQRQGDLLRLPWSAYDGQTIRLKQSKTGAKVTIPVGAPLKAALDATKKRGPLILMNTRGRAWTANGFHASWRKACMAAEVSGVNIPRSKRNGHPAVVSGRWNRGRDRNHHRP
jgi:integrase